MRIRGLNRALLPLLLCEFVILSFGFVLTHFASLASTRHYELGTSYTYDYVLGLELNEPGPIGNTTIVTGSTVTSGSGYRTGSTVGYKVLSQVQVTPVWQSEAGGVILEIQLIKPQLQIKSRKAPAPEGFHDHTSELDSAQLHPLYIHWKNGVIQKAFSVEGDVISLVNIKKGIANLLQFQPASGNVTEKTPLGDCNVSYKNKDSLHLAKTIHSQSCHLPTETDGKFFSTSHTSPVLGSTTESEIQVQVTLTKEAVFVEEASVVEKHVIRVTAKQEVGATITSDQLLKLTGSTTASTQFVKAPTMEAAIPEISALKGKQLKAETLVPHPENIPFCETTTCKAADVLTQVMTTENMASTKMANAFIQMVSKFRDASTEEISKTLEAKIDILPQLLDVCAATGSLNAHRAAMKSLDFDSAEEIGNPERYLLGISLSPTPNPEIVQDIFTLLKKPVKNEKLQESLILTAAALVHTIRKQKSSEAFGVDIETYLVDTLKKCPVEKPECTQMYLRALKNLKSKSTVTTLFEIVEKSDPKTGVVAMKALHVLPDAFFDRKTHRPVLLKIVKQLGKKYDSSSRTLALDILIRNHPEKEEIRELLTLLRRQDNLHAEVSTFMWHRLHEFMEANPKIGTYVKEILKEEGLKTYHHLAPKGLSTAFSRTLTANPSGNSSFSNAIEMTGKILKRSSFDVYVKSQKDSIHPLSLGIFAGGLSSFTASDDEEAPVEEDTEDATAGMELSLMGVQMRPIVFFVGKGELMGLVWSGAGSERTTALQGNVLLQDEKKVIPLYNGLVADINIQGGLSFDLAGQMTVSLWHRTASSLVENKAGLVLQSVIRVDTSFVRSRVDYTVASEASLHFTSDINFYDGVLMCLKLTQPEFTVKQNIHKTERIPGSKHRLRKAKYKTIPIPGLTYALNKKNSELCGVMHQKEEL